MKRITEKYLAGLAVAVLLTAGLITGCAKKDNGATQSPSSAENTSESESSSKESTSKEQESQKENQTGSDDSTDNNGQTAVRKLKDGLYTKRDDEPDSSGFIYQMTMKVEGGKITELVWDAESEEGRSKTEMAFAGEYIMTDTGLNWGEQAKALASYVIEHQSTEGITLDEKGKTDAISGVSISVDGFVSYVKALMEEASR